MAAALGRLLPAQRGHVPLDGKRIDKLPTREVAKILGVLPQAPTAPEGHTVADLAARGRHPHQAWYRQWSSAEELRDLRRTQISFVGQDPASRLNPRMRVHRLLAEIAALGNQAARGDPAAQRNPAPLSELLTEVHLPATADLLRRRPGQLSAGSGSEWPSRALSPLSQMYCCATKSPPRSTRRPPKQSCNC